LPDGMMNKNKIRINIVEEVAKMSKARRSKVGAILIKDEHIVAEGYNGTISGQIPDILEFYIPYKNKTPEHLKNIKILEIIKCPVCNGTGKRKPTLYLESIECNICKGQKKLKIFNKSDHDNIFHAEANLLLFCAKKGISTENGIMYITLSPCINCANLILQAGIKKVYYKDLYGSTDGINKLKTYIEVEQIL